MKNMIENLLEIKEIEEEDVQEEIKENLTEEQLDILSKIKERNFYNKDRLYAYKNGLNMAEIGRMTGYTRAAVSKYLVPKINENKEEINKQHRENRDKLIHFHNWYYYVYLSDLYGDYRRIKNYLSSTIRDDGMAYKYYLDYGGNKLEKKHEDKRRKLKQSKRERIVERLKNTPAEKVAFQERVKLDGVEKLAEEEGINLIYENDLGSSYYKDKYDDWMKRRENHRKLYLEKKKRKELEKNGI